MGFFSRKTKETESKASKAPSKCPKEWEEYLNEDEYDRSAAVEKLKDQETLAWIAKNDEEWMVRRGAVEKLKPSQWQELLADIAKNDEDDEAREIAVRKLYVSKWQDLFVDIAKNDENVDVCQAAVEKIKDQNLLSELDKKGSFKKIINSDLIKEHDLEKVKMLLAKGADVNAKDAEGKTALMNATYYGRKEIVKYLLEHGADVNARYVDGCTALIWAAGEGHAEILEILLEHGADIYITDRHNYTALMIANKMNRTTTARILEEWENTHS